MRPWPICSTTRPPDRHSASPVLNLVIEGLGSLRFGCTIGFLLPAIGPLIAAQARAWIPAVGFTGLAATVGWARFAGWWPDAAGTATLVVASLIAFGALVMAVRSEQSWWLAGATAVVSVLAGWLWVPCVGEYFSEPLNNASNEPLRSLLQVVAYVIGIAAPLLAVAALPVAIPRLAAIRDHRSAPVIGLAATFVVGAAIATGLYSDLVVRFAPGAG